ncbi:MAG: hypothetical protein H6660_17760 [Ardenticatenaceae bacterium]|nr:hypothetical protein [Ardenticatenaceae bacterium]
MKTKLKIGLPQMRQEPGERRAFLPSFVARLVRRGADVALETGYGAGLGLTPDDYLRVAPTARFVTHAEAYRQDYVLVLRYPSETELRLMQCDACLISMVHFPTRPRRVALLRELGLETISLDSIKDDSGRRLIENLRAVAWNGVKVAMETLATIYPPPGFTNLQRPPIRVTLLGVGAVGVHVAQAAIRYGDDAVRREMAASGVPGVQLTAVDYDLTNHHNRMRDILTQTDLLVDATQRPDASRPVISNDWIAYLPSHAVLLDLSVDPYNCQTSPMQVKGIEGVPHGNLDQYVFAPDDPAYAAVPACVPTAYRRYAVSCYSWPGVYPKACMEVYGRQLQPIFRTLIRKGGIGNIDKNGRFFERAISRAQLSNWR